MNKPRLPFDIQFLLESILTESPDQVLLGSRAARIISKGAKIKVSKVDSRSSDAVPFYIDAEYNVIVFSQYNQIHGHMESALELASTSAIIRKFDEAFEVGNMFGCVGAKHKTFDVWVYFYGLTDNSVIGMKKYLIENYDKFKKLDIRTYVNGKEAAKELSGRIWSENNVISFWNEKEKIDPHMNLVKNFMRKTGMNPNQCAYEFLDGKELFGYDDLEYDVNELEKVSKEEMRNLLRTQHLDPKAKRQLYMMSLEDPELAIAENKIKLKDLITNGRKN